MNHCIQLTHNLQHFSNTSTHLELRNAAVGILSILGNIKSVEINNSLNKCIFSTKKLINNVFLLFKTGLE